MSATYLFFKHGSRNALGYEFAYHLECQPAISLGCIVRLGKGLYLCFAFLGASLQLYVNPTAHQAGAKDEK